MALMLAAQQFQQNRMQRFCGKLLVQKARDHFINSRPYKQRNQDVRNISVPDMPDGQTAASIHKQDTAAH